MNQDSKNDIMFRMDVMKKLHEEERSTARWHLQVFKQRGLMPGEAEKIHEAVTAALAKECRGLAVKAELFALLYIYQPEALFRRRKLTADISDYTARIMGLNVANLSAQKKNLSFFYFKDKKFRAVATLAVEAVKGVIDKENM